MSDIGNVLQSAIDTTQTGMGNYLNTMKKYLETINVNRSQISVSLKPEDIQQGPAIKDQAADNGSEEKKVQ